MNTSLFEDLLTLIKKKSSIRNTEQAVEKHIKQQH